MGKEDIAHLSKNLGKATVHKRETPKLAIPTSQFELGSHAI